MPRRQPGQFGAGADGDGFAQAQVAVVVEAPARHVQHMAAAPGLHIQAVEAEVAQRRARVGVHLEGDLGAGKTTLARGLLRALGVQGAIRSPTYTLMETYDTEAGPVLHMDLYRLNDPLELHNLGLADFPVESSWWLVEWPRKGEGLLPPWNLRLSLRAEGSGRLIQIQSKAGYAVDI